jgi:hypothetical protein
MSTKPRLRQIAYVTSLERFEETLRFWTEAYGAGPFFVFDLDLADSTFRGEPSRTQCRVALTMLGEGQIEIIAPVGEQSRVYAEWIERHETIPQGGLYHHFRIDTDDVEQTCEHLLRHGAREGMRATAPGGRAVAYLDASETVGSYVEVIGQNEQSIALMERMREVCESWSGDEPIREYAAFITEVMGGAIAGYEPAAE